jgi:ubiquinone/menaquinone biosynthesis C-methylase UbiE
MNPPYSPNRYWTEIADEYSRAEDDGLAPVLHPNVPDWYNQTIDAMQFSAVLRALDVAKIEKGSRILDVGCGTGRWLRRYERLGYQATGLDLTLGMLSLARKNRTQSPLVGGESSRLPFKDSSFDAVSDITVVQHQLPASQPQAISEMLRVIKPGGRLILMELIRGKGGHIFPMPPGEWIHNTTMFGAVLLEWFGQEFMFLDRAFVKLARLVASDDRSETNDLQKHAHSQSCPQPVARELFWRVRHITASLSAQIDPTASLVFPARLATHGVFIFGK